MVFQTDQLEAEYEGDWDILYETFLILKEQSPERIEKLDQAINDNNFQQMEYLSHTLKGSFRIFFAENLSQISHKIEKESQEPESKESREWIQHLKVEYRNFIKEFALYIEGKNRAA